MTTETSDRLRAVAMPTEHGGWSFALEPGLLGLLAVFSSAGLALAAAALLAFVARTPLKIVLVDRWRGRRLPRSVLAARILFVELFLLAVLVAIAVATAQAAFWWPLAVAAPLILVELWHDMRSRSRRLVPELAGAIGIGSVAAAIALAGGEGSGLALGLWIVIGSRSGSAIPLVRVQLLRSKAQDHRLWHSDLGQVIALSVVALGWQGGIVPISAVIAIAATVVFGFVAVRRPPVRAAVIGAQEVVVGLTVVLATGLGVRAP